jgi:DNA repair photolyase
VLRRELRRPSRYRALHRETVVIGTATDPYQPAERRFRVTRGVLETLSEQQGLSVTIITKSPLVTRDVDLLLRIATRSRLSVHVSLITADRELARRLEPRAPTPEARLRAIARLRAHGIEVGVNVMPVLPGITDSPRLLQALVRAVAETNASYLGACALRLQSAARQRYLPFIEAEFPHLASRYRATYSRSHQAGDRYREGLREYFRALCAEHGVVFDRYYKSEDDDDDEEMITARGAASAQLTLSL